MKSDFNKLGAREKWDTWVKQEGTWHCPECGTQLGGGPSRVSPFRGASINCGGCDAELTRRTGGGQNDPFGWELRGPCHGSDTRDCEGRCPNCDAEQKNDPCDEREYEDGVSHIWVCPNCDVKYEEFVVPQYAHSAILSWRIGLEPVVGGPPTEEEVKVWHRRTNSGGHFDTTTDPEEAQGYDDADEAKCELNRILKAKLAPNGWVEPAPVGDQG